jgi:hypothetical protein
MCADIGYRPADRYPRQTLSQLVAAEHAADLRGPIASLLVRITLLEVLAEQVEADRAVEAISDAFSAIQAAISALTVAADRVIDDANENEGSDIMSYEEYAEENSFEEAIRAEEEEESCRYEDDSKDYELLASYAGQCSC